MKTTLPDIPGARRLIQVNWRIVDAYGAREQEGTLKLTTSRWAFSEPFLLAEIIQEIGRKWEDFSDPVKARIEFTWSFLPLPHPLSSVEERWLEWLKNQSQ